TIRAEADAALGRERKTAASVDTAVAATQAALRLLPGDAALIEAAAKLKGKLDALKLALEGFESRLESARSALRARADAARAAAESVKSAASERGRREQDIRAAREKIAATKARGEALRTELAEATDELTNLLGSRFAMAQLKPLTAEQMYWSM